MATTPRIRLRVLPALLPRQIELRSDGTNVQWRYQDDDWQDVLPLTDITPTVTIGTVTTLPAGSSATVVNAGTVQDLVLNFGLPKGNDGTMHSVVAGTNVSVNNTDPANPIISSTIPDGDKGDITASSTGTVWTIDNDVVTNAKLANMATATFKGRTTAGTGDPEDLTATQATALLNAATTSLPGLVQLVAAALNSNSASLVPTASGSAPPFGHCQLTKVSTNLSLARYSGTKLFINGVFEVIPTTPVTLPPGAAVAGTLYYIYAFMSAGVMTLEFSATAPATDATYGHQIKTADATRTLVGMARAAAGPVWVDSATQRFVISYFNRRRLAFENGYAADQTTSTSLVEASTTIRCEFLTWADEMVQVASHGAWANNGARSGNSVAIAFDGTTPENNAYFTSNTPPNGGDTFPFALSISKAGLAVGYHYATLLFKAASGTLTVKGAAAGSERSSLTGNIAG